MKIFRSDAARSRTGAARPGAPSAPVSAPPLVRAPV